METESKIQEDPFKDMDPKQREWFELLNKKEELHPDLKKYLEHDSRVGSLILKHPLVFEIFYTPQRNAMLNKQYETKLEYVNKKTEEKNWSGVLVMYERPYRIPQLLELASQMSDEEYWENLGWVWSDSENLWQYHYVLGSLLRADRPGKEKMMDDDEKAFLASLPEEFTIYRGHHGVNRKGHSWTLSYWKAKWFANRFSQRRKGVVKATIRKEHVHAVLLGRNEFEIVTEPRFLDRIISIKQITHTDWVQKALDEATAGFALSKIGSAHGLWHWEKVERNGHTLAKATPECDHRVVQLFALLHDSKRTNEDDDPEHGFRAAEFVEQMYKEEKLRITIAQKELLTYACRLHNDGQTSDNPTIGVCWDADRLDLTRVGIIPDDKYLSTKAGKEMKWKV